MRRLTRNNDRLDNQTEHKSKISEQSFLVVSERLVDGDIRDSMSGDSVRYRAYLGRGNYHAPNLMTRRRKRFTEETMPARISLTETQLDFVLDAYYGVLRTAEFFEDMERALPDLIKKGKKDKRKRGLRRIREMLKLAARNEGMTQKQLGKGLGSTERTIEMDLANFRDVGLVVAESIPVKGEWGKPGSRAKLSGRPPLTYKFNSVLSGLASGDFLVNSDLSDEQRRTLWLVCRILFRSSGFVEASARSFTALMRLFPQLPAVIELVNEIPELSWMSKNLNSSNDIAKMHRMVMLNCPVPEELFVEPKMWPLIWDKNSEEEVTHRPDLNRILLFE